MGINNLGMLKMLDKLHRILYKVSGEALMGGKAFGHDTATIHTIALDIASVLKTGIEIAIVIGGGNIFRGVNVSAKKMQRVNADYMGMLATVINALALQSALDEVGVNAVVQTAANLAPVCEHFNPRKAEEYLSDHKVVIFAFGTGNPFFTTDTASVLRALETRSDAVIKGSQVDGIYSADPKLDPQAVHYDSLSFQEVLEKGYRVMDMSAFGLAKENNLPIVVFSIMDSLEAVLGGKAKCTVVCN